MLCCNLFFRSAGWALDAEAGDAYRCQGEGGKGRHDLGQPPHGVLKRGPALERATADQLVEENGKNHECIEGNERR